ncbi:MAG: OB-fold nucleic acid binding domain-containing protein, partial [Oscillospiraceae bacterium]|nr:OB-fold nucleic acid binding domain-containing protein [Oscillospiraceae bacterium]
AVKGVGRGFVTELMAQRAEDGPFTTFEEFCRRMYGRELNRRPVESLIRAGAFDSLGYRRRVLISVLDLVLDEVNQTGRSNVVGQMDMFSMADADPEPPMELPDLEEFSPQELMAMEKEYTGLYLTGHPMDDYRKDAQGLGAVAIGAILDAFSGHEEEPSFQDGQTVSVAGIVQAARTRTTKNNTLMSYVTLEDDTGSMELLAFQRTLDQAGEYLTENSAIYCTGRISVRDEKEPQLMLDLALPLRGLTPEKVAQYRRPARREREPGREEPPQRRTLWVKLPAREEQALHRIELVLTMFPGTDPMVIYFADTKKRLGARCLIHPALVEDLQERFGAENVIVK